MKLNTRGLLVVISGPSGVGKGTVRKALFNRTGHNLDYSVSMTTRAPREGEIDGSDYYFVSKEEFLNQILSLEDLIHLIYPLFLQSFYLFLQYYNQYLSIQYYIHLLIT